MIDARGTWLSNRALWVYWLLALVTLLALLGGPPVQRTQEARVLETAREMLGGGWHGWMIPQLNGERRLKKPPLPYWMSAVAFKLAGVNETAGRVPTALTGWLTLGVTYAAGAWLFNRRAGAIGGAALLSSYLFFRHSRLAETDAPAMLFVTLAVYAFLRAAGRMVRPPWPAEPMPSAGGTLDYEREPVPEPALVPVPGHFVWLHVAAASTALAFLAKGAPGFFPLLFLLLHAAVMRRWDVPRRFLTSGAVATMLVLSLAWYAYMAYLFTPRAFINALRVVTTGEDHEGAFYVYFYLTFIATAPWSLLLIGGLFEAVRRWRTDLRLREVLLWSAAVLVPLLLTGNKQFHYLMPVLPPLLLLVGWLIDAAAEPDADPKFALAVRRLAIWTAVGACAAVAIGVPIGSRAELGRVPRFEVAFAIAAAATAVAMALAFRLRGLLAGVGAFIVAAAVGMTAVAAVWIPGLEPGSARTIARQIKAAAPHGPYYFYRGSISLTLCFNLREIIPRLTSADSLADRAAAEPEMVLIVVAKEDKTAKLPDTEPGSATRFERIAHFTEGDEDFSLYRPVPD